MRSNILSKQSLSMILLIGVVLFFAFVLNIFPQSSKNLENESASLISKNLVKFGRPSRLIIPKIKVNATVKYVGVTAEGAMGVPKGPTEVAWFNFGPRPGEVGSAVISGHYGWKNNIPAVFDNLNKLQKGDELSIKDEKGILTIFVVRESRIFKENQDASSVFASSDGRSHLNLITCGGIWNKERKSYSNRLIIFTDKK